MNQRMKECLHCGKKTETKFCSKEHKWTHEKKMNEIVPVIANRDFISPSEAMMIDKFISSGKVKRV